MSRCTLHRTLNVESLHVFYLQRVQLLLPEDYSERVRFAQWYLQQSDQEVNFLGYVLLTAIFD